MIKTVERRPDLPEQAYTFGAVLAKLTKPVIPAIREPVHLSCQRIRAGQGTVAVADICARIKTAAPDRRVVATVGDGSWMLANPQVCTWAAQYHDAPVLFVVSDNRGYRTGTHEVAKTYPEGYSVSERDYTGGQFGPGPSYAAEAAASGCFGERVTDPAELSAALSRAVKAVDSGVPAVLDVWLPGHDPGGPT